MSKTTTLPERVFFEDPECGWRGPQAVLDLVAGLCAKAGIDCADARIAGTPGQNTLVVLENAGLVARVAEAAALDRLREELLTAAFFESAGIPVPPRPSTPPSAQLTVADGYAVTWWEFLRGPRASWPRLGATLYRLHGVGVPEPGLCYLQPRLLDPFSRLQRQLRAADRALPASDREALARRAAALAQRWTSSSLASAPRVLLHGDAYPANTIVVDGRTHLLDFEDTAIGPALYDLRAVFAFHRLGWISDQELGACLAAYGEPVPEQDAELLAEVRLLQMTGHYAALTAGYPHLVAQTRLRIASLDDPELLPGWWSGLRPEPKR